MMNPYGDDFVEEDVEEAEPNFQEDVSHLLYVIYRTPELQGFKDLIDAADQVGAWFEHFDPARDGAVNYRGLP